ncbi:MAG: AI-2E family transporter [Nitrososphaerales archaeon]
MRRFAVSVLLVFAILLLAVILWRISSIVFLFIISLAIAAATRAPIEGLMDRGVPRVVAVLAVYGFILLTIGALGYFLFVTLGRELGNISEDLTTIYRTLAIRWGGGILQNSPALAARLPTPEQLGHMLAAGDFNGALSQVAGFTSGVADFLTHAGIALVVSIYWISDRLHFERLLLSLLPPTQRTRARAMWRTLEAGLGAYLRSELVQGVLAAILLAPAFALLGLKYPVFWALVGALLWFIPLVGALIFLAPLWLVTWVQNGPVLATGAVAYSIFVFAFLELVVERGLVMPEGRSNILVLLVMLAMTDALGLVGLLLAPPIAMAVHIFLTQLVTPVMTTNEPEAITPTVQQLEARLEEVRSLIGGLQTSNAPRLSSMTERMAELLQQAHEVRDEAGA